MNNNPCLAWDVEIHRVDMIFFVQVWIVNSYNFELRERIAHQLLPIHARQMGGK